MATDIPEEINPDEDVGVTFRDLGLDPKILKALDDMGYEKPTPIQARAIPEALQNRDVLGIAQTGTGKTGAFTLPTVHKLAKGRARARMPRCLIVCPTRELAAQVAENVESYGKYLKLEMALLIGGVSFAEQNIKLNKGVDVLIATPGRLLDQFERGKILLTGVQTLVVDEADRMLDMGFIPDIERIFQLTPFTRQVLFFSATMPNEIKRLVDQFLHQPVTIQVARKNMTADTVRERIVRLPTSDAKVKRTTIRWLIDNLENQDDTANNGIIFCNRKRDVDIVAKSLTVHGYPAAPIHGDLAQSLRMETLEKFKSGELRWLVASDVAARGLDIPDVSFVFNYDVPNHAEDYVHRIGRTGRAGRKGDAVMLVARLDSKNFDAILHMTKRDDIEELDIPGIEDFAKDDGRHRKNDRKGGRSRGGRDGGRGRGRGDSRGRSGGSRDRNRDEAPKPSPKAEAVETKEEMAPKTARSSSRRAAPAGRRKAPTRKREDDAPAQESNAEVEAKETKPERAPSSSRRRAAPKRKTPKSDDRPSQSEAKSETKSEPRKTESRGNERQSDDRSRHQPKPDQKSERSGESGKRRSRSSNRDSHKSSQRDEGRDSGKRSDKSSRRKSEVKASGDRGFNGDIPNFFKN